MTEIGSNVESSGRALYHRWCGSETSDEARYYDLMNPACKDRWEALGREIDQQDIGHNFAIQKRIEAIAERDALAARVEALEAQRDEALRALEQIERALDHQSGRVAVAGARSIVRDTRRILSGKRERVSDE